MASVEPRFRVLGNAFPFSLRTILTIIVGMLALSVQAQEIYTGAIAISPSQRTNSWRPTNTLAPGDSAKLSITVAQSGSDNGRNYTLHGNPIQHPPISSPPGSIIWRGNYSSLHACNAGNSPGTTTATVTAEWVETGSGGGGSGGSPSIIYGKATGIAQADIPVFNWSFDRRMQYADGTSPITYTVTGSITGRRVSMSAYSVKPLSGELSVTNNTPESTNIRTGKITSTNSAKSKMGVYYGERELARSTNEIAFGKVDLIVPQGPGTNGGTPLPEDRLTNGGTAPATNELNPGTFVLLYGEDQTNRVATTLTLKADPTGGSVTLDQHGLTDLKIYSDGALQEELTLPKTWTNGDTPPSTLYMVVSSSSTNLQSAQGTLDLTYKANLAADGVEYSIKDTVGVTLLPFDIKAYRPEIVQQSVDLRPSDQTKLVIPDAEKLNPGVRIRVNRDDDDYDSQADAEGDSVIGENDLVKVEFSCAGLAEMTGIKVLLKRNNSKLRVWEAKEKGTAILKNEDEKELTVDAQGSKSIWVEAIDQGEGELEWQLKSGGIVIGIIGKLKFITYKELIVGLSGETFYSGSANGNGMFDVCQKLYLEGYNVAYYDVHSINTTSGDPAYREAGFQISQCFVQEIGIFGHSHGGGATHDISKKINDARSSLGSFGINFTGYVDAIRHDGTFERVAETRYPPSSLYHWNYYQRHLPIMGNAVFGAATNLDVNTTTWGSSLGHLSIDNDPTVQNELHSTIKTHVAP